MAVIILGDLHIGKNSVAGKVGIGSALNSRVVDQIKILDWVLEQAIDNGISEIIITGDVFEEPKPLPYLITLFISWLKRCEYNAINVHIVIGNHDILRSGNYYTSPLDIISESELPNSFIYKELTTTYINGIAFTFLPFRDRKSFAVNSNSEALALLHNNINYEISSIPPTYTKILIGHLALEGSIFVGDEVDDLSNELFCPLYMFDNYDYVWMGHVHKPQILNKKPYIAHIGSMDISNFGECDHKKHIVIFDPELDDKIKHITIPTRQLKKLIITVPKDTKDVDKYVLDEIEKNKDDLSKSIVKLEINLSDPELLSINRTNIEKSLYDIGAHNVAGISETKKSISLKKENNNIDTSIDIKSAIKLWAEKQILEDKKSKFIEVANNIYMKFKQGNN